MSRLDTRRAKPQASGLEGIDSVLLLEELSRRGGHPGAVADAVLLCIRKSADYNFGEPEDPHAVNRDGYFPLGLASHAQMLHTKAERFMSLTKKILGGGEANFEGLRDTALDLINYSGFFLADKRDLQ